MYQLKLSSCARSTNHPEPVGSTIYPTTQYHPLDTPEPHMALSGGVSHNLGIDNHCLISPAWILRPFGDDFPIHSPWFQGSVATWGRDQIYPDSWPHQLKLGHGSLVVLKKTWEHETTFLSGQVLWVGTVEEELFFRYPSSFFSIHQAEKNTVSGIQIVSHIHSMTANQELFFFVCPEWVCPQNGG